jgi:WD40 repeat protein
LLLVSDVAPSPSSFPIKCSQLPQRLSGKVWNARFSPDGMMVAAGCEDGQAHLWKVRASLMCCEACMLSLLQLEKSCADSSAS